MRDLFVMSYETRQSRKMMSLTVKITALWALKVPLEEYSRFFHVEMYIFHGDPRDSARVVGANLDRDGGLLRARNATSHRVLRMSQ